MAKRITPSSQPVRPEIIRPDWDEYFLKVVSVVAERSTCRRHNMGAIAVRDKHILSTGYNGAPAGLKDCLELGCLRDELGIASGTRQEICRAIHAEQNVIIQAALHGVSIEGATIYCTHTPLRPLRQDAGQLQNKTLCQLQGIQRWLISGNV